MSQLKIKTGLRLIAGVLSFLVSFQPISGYAVAVQSIMTDTAVVQTVPPAEETMENQSQPSNDAEQTQQNTDQDKTTSFLDENGGVSDPADGEDHRQVIAEERAVFGENIPSAPNGLEFIPDAVNPTTGKWSGYAVNPSLSIKVTQASQDQDAIFIAGTIKKRDGSPINSNGYGMNVMLARPNEGRIEWLGNAVVDQIGNIAVDACVSEGESFNCTFQGSVENYIAAGAETLEIFVGHVDSENWMERFIDHYEGIGFINISDIEMNAPVTPPASDIPGTAAERNPSAADFDRKTSRTSLGDSPRSFGN